MHVLRQACRHLARRKSATLLSVGLLALGVGLAASFYSVLDSALLSGLPFPDGDRLVAFSTRDAAGWPMPKDDFRAIEEAQMSFEWTAPLRTFNTMVTRGNATIGMIGSYVTADLFERLDVFPSLGRGFEPEDEDPSRPPVALISHRLWHSSYGADPAVIGEEIVLNRETSIVVGVMPPGFRFPLRHDVWGVLRDEGRDWSESFVFGFAKLAPGVDMSAAQSDLARITAALDEVSPQAQPRNAAVESFVRANIGDRASAALRAMVIAALGLLLLTCANLANLRLGETLRRQRELDTRLALGSGSGGLAKMLLVENLIIGLFGTVLALGVAWLLASTLGKALLSGGYLERTFWIEARLNLQVARFAAGIALLATLLGALAPIVSTALSVRGRTLLRSGSPHRRSLWARCLVAAQVGLCFALLVAAGLVGAKARELLETDLGFRSERLSSIMVSTYQAELDSQQHGEFFERFRDELRLESEVAEVALSSSPPWAFVPRFPIARGGEPDREIAPTAEVLTVSGGFFRTLELPLLAGRDFIDSDVAVKEPEDQTAGAGEDESTAGDEVAIVSRSFAERFLGPAPVGDTFFIGGRRADEPSRRARVVGVVADLGVSRSDSVDRDLNVYLPDHSQTVGSFALIRTAPGVLSARPVVERVLGRIEPRVGTLDELSVEQARSRAIWVERRLGQIFTLFGVAALLLTASGMYAVIAVMVRNRERELGIRAAVGARPRQLQTLVLSESGLQLGLGLIVGAAVLVFGHRLLDRVLAESLGWQPIVIVASACVVAVTCLLATWLPSSRAANADPSRCLRAE